VSLLAGYPCDPVLARRAAEEAAIDGWPPPLRTEIAVNALIGPVPVADAADMAKRAVRDGTRCFKVKVGDQDDIARVAAVRDAIGPQATLRIDANGSWDLDTAVSRLAAMSRFDLEFVEEPLGSLEELAALRRRIDVPIAADESVRTLADARRLVRLGAADAIVLKVQPSGGVRAALALAEAAQVPAIVTSMLETSVGLAAGLALAAALPESPFASGLGTASIWADDIVDEPLLSHHGRLEVRRATPSPDRLARFAWGTP
jgi:O-succinylbenzoate synthase